VSANHRSTAPPPDPPRQGGRKNVSCQEKNCEPASDPGARTSALSGPGHRRQGRKHRFRHPCRGAQCGTGNSGGLRRPANIRCASGARCRLPRLLGVPASSSMSITFGTEPCPRPPIVAARWAWRIVWGSFPGLRSCLALPWAGLLTGLRPALNPSPPSSGRETAPEARRILAGECQPPVNCTPRSAPAGAAQEPTPGEGMPEPLFILAARPAAGGHRPGADQPPRSSRGTALAPKIPTIQPDRGLARINQCAVKSHGSPVGRQRNPPGN